MFQYNHSTISNETTLFPQMDFNLYKMPQPKIQTYEGCSPITASKNLQFEFNITTEGAAAKQWQLLDSTVSKSHKNLRGEIIIDRGSFFQPSDIDVRVIVGSNNKMGLDNVLFNRSDSTFNINYNSTDKNDLCTEIRILVYLRPWPRRILDLFDIRTNNLDILFQPCLNWEINNLIAHTSHGEFTMDSHQPFTDPLIAHNVSVSSIDGEIFGWFIPDENLELRNINGQTGIFICPRLGAGRPFDPKLILISSFSGDIFTRTVSEVWPPKAYTHQTKIETVSGRIEAEVPHGQYTNFSTISGNISTYIRPYGAASPDAMSEIYTTSQSGSIDVYFADPPNESLTGRYNPLLNTISKHDVGEGKLKLIYPYGWYGEMEAKIEHGGLEFDGSSMEDIKWGKGYVKARRGRKGESRMEARVGTGDLDIRLGL
ncbi:hypothetical protein K432DRAFT_309509 [Lepidopterella palustris CBS 459.81]|uniref:Uncharacterized protein n=1 Tax=Lepidopterella palustris CBS 459.81 TaxID=1314670 RepID=A0A8E2E079_9PEZI|nr:hypothetical protein K432DRAFT_309509 [Lepidopterella palustris CBS 459.81]